MLLFLATGISRPESRDDTKFSGQHDFKNVSYFIEGLYSPPLVSDEE
jgi:hypothetical protein